MLQIHSVRKIVVKYKFACLAAMALVLTTISLFAISKRNISSERDLNNTANLSPAFSSIRAANKNCGLGDKTDSTQTKVASFNGISFVYDPPIASEVKMELVPASPLENETDKPDMVAPEHVAFTFSGPYALQHESSFFSPQIHIYSISDYNNALSKSALYVQELRDEILSLKAMLSERTVSVQKEIPFLPFGIDAYQSFRAHVKYIDFKEGKGVIFLTQYNIEPSLINNSGLIYTFQGLTDDGLYYVSATFPVAAPILSKDLQSGSFEDYSLPEYFYDKNHQLNEQAYQKYLTKIETKLEALPANKYEPNLTLFEKLISSLCITTIKTN